MRRHKVGHDVRFFDCLSQRPELIREVWRQANRLLKQSGNGAPQGFDFLGAVWARLHVFDDLDARSEIRLILDLLDDPEAGNALYNQPSCIGHLDEGSNNDGATVLVNVFKPRLVHLRILLGDHADDAVVANHALVNELNSGIAADRKRSDQHWIDDAIAQRKNVQNARNVRLSFLLRPVFNIWSGQVFANGFFFFDDREDNFGEGVFGH